MIYSLTDSRGVRWQTLMVQERDYWMVIHDRMRYSYDKPDWRLNPERNGLARAAARIDGKSKPQVYRVKPDQVTRLSPAWIDLLVAINPDLTEQNARDLLNVGLMFCNREYGVFDFPRLMGGAIVTGQRGNGVVHLSHYLTSDPTPSAAEVLADPTTWFWCTGVQPDGDVNYIQYTGKDGQKHPSRMFIVANVPLEIPEGELLYLGKVYPANYDPRVMR